MIMTVYMNQLNIVAAVEISRWQVEDGEWRWRELAVQHVDTRTLARCAANGVPRSTLWFGTKFSLYQGIRPLLLLQGLEQVIQYGTRISQAEPIAAGSTFCVSEWPTWSRSKCFGHDRDERFECPVDTSRGQH